MKKLNPYSLFTGIILILIGIIILLKTTGVINIAIWEGFSTYWPVGLILAGIAFMLKARALGIVFIALTIIFGGVFVADQFVSGETRMIVQEVPFDENITHLELDLDFGAGEVFIAAGSDDYLVKNIVNTSDIENPVLKFKKTGSDAKVSISRDGSFPAFGNVENQWDVRVSPTPTISMDLDYGASEMKIDLRGLKTDELDIDSGATSTKVIFGLYSTAVEINTGASELNLKFPEEAGVKIEIDGGAIGTDLPKFKKLGSTYYSDDYDEKEVQIKINIDAGATSISGKFYEAEENEEN
ncbi:LiaI-LiaF-like domain-containing protein [Bacteroidota bacterium]